MASVEDNNILQVWQMAQHIYAEEPWPHISLIGQISFSHLYTKKISFIIKYNISSYGSHGLFVNSLLICGLNFLKRLLIEHLLMLIHLVDYLRFCLGFFLHLLLQSLLILLVNIFLLILFPLLKHEVLIVILPPKLRLWNIIKGTILLAPNPSSSPPISFYPSRPFAATRNAESPPSALFFATPSTSLIPKKLKNSN